MIEELIERVFAARNAAHLAHWAETSGFRHTVLGDFYEGVIDLLDGLVESHQGAFGLVEVGALAKQPKVEKIIDLLEEDLVWINKNRKALTQGLPALDNLLQGLEGLYLSTLYKLRKLA